MISPKIQEQKYIGIKFMFGCRACSKFQACKCAFKFDHFQPKKAAVLRCCNCGALISRKRKLLDEQIKEREMT